MEKGTKRRVKKLGTAFFVLYVLVLVYLLFFSEGYGRVADAEREYRYNLVPFVEIRRFWTYRKIVGTFALFTNVFGNVLGFVPYGFILPVITGKMRNGFFIILSGFFISLTIEVIQLLTKVGCFDVDDMILNTLGAALGYGIYAVCDRIREKLMARRYRYAFAKKREASKGKWSVGLAAASLVLFIAAVVLALFFDGKLGGLIGGTGLFAMLLSAYGFTLGLSSFSEENRKHRTSMVGSILNGVILVIWLGLFLSGV